MKAKRLREMGRTLRQRMVRQLGQFHRDTRGGIAAVVAISSPVLIGGMGLGGEVGYWYMTERKLQNAADVAAHAVANRMGAGDQGDTLQGMADYLVDQADVDMGFSTVTVNNPPLSGAFVEDGNAVEIIVDRTVPRMFSAIYDPTPIDISARAVATATSGGRGCVIALNPTADGAITVTGSNAINLLQCDFIANSSSAQAFDMQGLGSNALANCVQTTGQAVTTANLTTTCATLRQNAAPVADPFLTVAEPAATGACIDGNVGQNNQTTSVTPTEAHSSGMTSMRFCNGLNLRGTVNLSPGLYLVEGGDFRINSNADINGSGVVFYLAPDVEMKFNGSANVNLSSPMSGNFTGMLFFGSRTATTISHTINGNFGSALDGAIYTPASHIDWSGNSQTSFTSCTQIIVDTVDFTGSSFLNLHCLFPPGQTVEVAGTVTVVE